MFTKSDGTGHLPYTTGAWGKDLGHLELFSEMKDAAALKHTMGDCTTKMRSFGAMNAADFAADDEAIERMGR